MGQVSMQAKGVSAMRLASITGRTLLGVLLVAAPLAGNAAPVSGSAVKPADNSLLLQVQHRHYRGGGYRHGGGYYHGGGDGGAVAAGAIFGLLLGGMIAASQAQQQRSVEYCARRFRSYDPYSMTYLGYDGLRHRCP
jgi:hypothetical protein